MKPEIPADLLLYQKKQKQKAIIVTIIALFVAIMLLVIIVSSMENHDSRHNIFTFVFFVFVAAFICVVTRFPTRYIDKTFYGTIKKLKVDSRKKQDFPLVPAIQNPQYWHMTHTLIITVKTINGKTIQHKVFSLGNASSNALLDYKVGDEVFHIYGSKYTVKVPDNKAEYMCCSICGSNNIVDNDVCRNCSHSLFPKISFYESNDNSREV